MSQAAGSEATLRGRGLAHFLRVARNGRRLARGGAGRLRAVHRDLPAIAFDAIRPPRSVGFARDIPDFDLADFAARDRRDPFRSDAVVNHAVLRARPVVVDHLRVAESHRRFMTRQTVPVRMWVTEIAVMDEIVAIPSKSETEAHAHAGAVVGEADASAPAAARRQGRPPAVGISVTPGDPSGRPSGTGNPNPPAGRAPIP